ncbi:MAG: hypothetical protein Tsb0013_15930 [Phycisphaerales bacterium]
MNKRASCRGGNVLVITIVALAAIVLAWIAFSVVSPAETPEEEEARLRREALAALQLVEFNATAADGSAFTREALTGGWTLLSFGFTHCQLACPPMHANTMRLIAKLENTPLRFVTLSVDPVHDTPERLREYTAQLGADPDRWTFVAMDADQRDAVLDGLGMSVSIDTSDANRITLPGSDNVMNNIDHPTRFILIGPEGEVVDMYPGMTSETLEDTARSIRGHMLGG